jgi:hypothetical protein
MLDGLLWRFLSFPTRNHVASLNTLSTLVIQYLHSVEQGRPDQSVWQQIKVLAHTIEDTLEAS